MQKERYEWIHSWCDETLNEDLPRVLLVGDSITHGYQNIVRESLRGKAYVDYISTSYSIDMKIFRDLVNSFVKDSKYSVIHFNHGLHGETMTKRTYEAAMRKMLQSFEPCKIIVATSTIVYNEGNKKVNAFWKKKLKDRNGVVFKLAAERFYSVDDLFETSAKIPADLRTQDGFHYLENGYKILAESVVSSIEKIL